MLKLEWSTYLGGSGSDQAREVILCPDGSLLVGAQTASADMPATVGVVQPHYAGDDPALGHSGIYGGDCYLARLSGLAEAPSVDLLPAWAPRAFRIDVNVQGPK